MKTIRERYAVEWQVHFCYLEINVFLLSFGV